MLLAHRSVLAAVPPVDLEGVNVGPIAVPRYEVAGVESLRVVWTNQADIPNLSKLARRRDVEANVLWVEHLQKNVLRSVNHGFKHDLASLREVSGSASARLSGTDPTSRVLLIGDSNARALLPGLRKENPRCSFNFIETNSTFNNTGFLPSAANTIFAHKLLTEQEQPYHAIILMTGGNQLYYSSITDDFKGIKAVNGHVTGRASIISPTNQDLYT